MKKLNTDVTLQDLVKASNSRMMTITFIKKNGDLRVMYAKTGVHSKKTGLPKRSRKKNPSVCVVFDCQKKEKRAFRWDSVLELKYGHTIYRKN